MSATEVGDLSSRLDAVVEESKERAKAFQTEAETARHEVQERFQKFLPIAERIVAIARQKLEQLKERLEFDVIPAQFQTEQSYSRSVVLDVKSELAGLIKLAFRLTHDSDVRNISLAYDLQITPVFFRFNSHSEFEMPIEAFDEAVVGKWLDDRIIEFANVLLEMRSTKQHQARVMVSDTVAGITFPKYYAAATLDHDGTTYYFISEETRREFAKRHGLNL
jgi:YHS domain-containing protein